jgi:two-component system NarL family response regulator
VNILLVDDNGLFLSGLSNLLNENGHTVIGVATSGAQVLELVNELHPELVLMDVQMPEQDGIVTTRKLKYAYPLLTIVMMTISENDVYLFDAITAGASGYLIKGSRPELFLEALASIARGESPLSSGLAGKVMAEFSRRERLKEDTTGPTGALLSDRQKEILRLVSQGVTYRDIASQLNLSERTIKYHMAEITSRLHVDNRVQLLRSADKLFAP